MKKLIKVLAFVASIGGVCFLFRDKIKEAIEIVKGKFTKDENDGFEDDDDFDEEEIFGKSSDREYVDIPISDGEDEETSDDETADDKEAKED